MPRFSGNMEDGMAWEDAHSTDRMAENWALVAAAKAKAKKGAKDSEALERLAHPRAEVVSADRSVAWEN
jgi:hypothetical protein